MATGSDRQIFRSLRAGGIVDKRWLRFSFATFLLL